MSFNAEQTEYIEYLGHLAPEVKCWCGWYKLGECPHCPPGKTSADKMAVWCPECHNDPGPGPNGGTIIHRFDCKRGGK